MNMYVHYILFYKFYIYCFFCAFEAETIDIKDIQAFFQLYNVDLSNEQAKELIETLVQEPFQNFLT